MRPHRRSSPSPRAPGADAQIELGRHEARPLFQLVDGLVEQVEAPQVDALVLDGSMDVVVERHRSGIDVALGLPLLEALPVSEVRALLLCALAPTRRLARGKDANGAVKSAGEAAGSVVVATALVRRALVGHVLNEDYWPAVFHGTQSSAHPHVKPFSSLRRTLRAHVEAGALRTSASRLFAVEPAAEHEASLVEQLRALGIVPLDAVDAALLPVTSPATELVGHAYESILARLDAKWCERVDAWWEKTHADALRQVLGEETTPARVWTQATALARYSESLDRAPTAR